MREGSSLPDILAIEQTAQSIGWLSAIMIVIGVAGSVFFLNYVRRLALSIQSMAVQVKNLEEALLSEKGNPLTQYSALMGIHNAITELRQDTEKHIIQAERHYQTLEDDSADERWKNCDIERCVHLQKIIAAIREVNFRFDEFDSKAQEVRTTTGSSLEGIRGEMSKLGSEIGDQKKQIIDVLTSLLLNRKMGVK